MKARCRARCRWPTTGCPKEGRTPAIIVSVAHLDDDERTLVCLQTDADRERVTNANEPGSSAASGPCWFLLRDVHATPNRTLLQPRWALSFCAGR